MLKVTPEGACAAWTRLPWRARLLVLLCRRWPRLGAWPLLGNWMAWAHVELLDRVIEARDGAPAEVRGDRGDCLIHTIILVLSIPELVWASRSSS